MMIKLHKYLLLVLLALIPVAAFSKSDVKRIIKEVKTQYAPDKRQIVYEIDTDKRGGVTTITGKISERAVYEALIAKLDSAGVKYVDKIVLMPVDEWLQVRISVASLRQKKGHASEMATQAVMGTPLRVLEKDGDWYRVQTPDGYVSYVINSSVTSKSDAEMRRWRGAARVIVTSFEQTKIYAIPDASARRNIISDAVNGMILEGVYDQGSEFTAVTIPDGRKGFIKTSDVKPLEQWASQDFNADLILDVAYSMLGAPYLWGGMSTKTLDCSGLAKVCYFANGIILMRDASQQATTGQRVEASDWKTCRPGDLLFFGNAQTRKVTHVAIYEGGGQYIHSSGRVKVNSVDPQSSLYLSTPFLHASRIEGNVGTRGITSAAVHPWLFNK